MSAEELWADLTEVFRECFDDEDIELRRETTAEDIEDWDSITNVQLMVAIESRFGIRLNTGEVVGLSNVGELADLIAQRRSG